MASNSMRHWNAHQMCVLDVETTGIRQFWHEIIQISAIALDANLNIRKDILPFNVFLRPEYPERIDPEAMRITKLSIHKLLVEGFSPDKAIDLFTDWVEKLELGQTKFGNKKRIIPLAHNWTFDRGFIQEWLGYTLFDEIFDSRSRDTMIISTFMNDCASFRAETPPYSKNTLTWLAKKLGIPHPTAHDSLQDCIVTAEVYKALCTRGLMPPTQYPI